MLFPYYSLKQHLLCAYYTKEPYDYYILYIDNKKVIDNNTLTALTLLIAESNPKEKEVYVTECEVIGNIHENADLLEK